MVQVLQARDATLRDLIDRFGLQRVQDSQFFHEWQESLPEITELERQYLDKVKAGYLNLIEYPPLLEKQSSFRSSAQFYFWQISSFLPFMFVQKNRSKFLMKMKRFQFEDRLIFCC